jgi:hypothetical protein
MSSQEPEIPGYRIERPLGEGGMATVYLATQLSLDRRVALKVLSREACRDEAQALRFEREARLIAALEHPHIVGIFEVGRSADGRPYYAMPYMPNGDLASAGIVGNEAAVIEVLEKILGALEHAHARGIVHRDVKPANVLFDGYGQPRLADFGIARPAPADCGRLTGEGLALGSGYYMAPEQARGLEVDARADLYSVGVMAYELLTGELPFQGPDPLALALQHLTAPIPRLPASLSHWQTFIDRALAKAPAERFASAAEMRAALTGLRGAEPPPARPHPGRWVLAAIAVPLALLGLWLGRERDAGPPDFFLLAPRDAGSEAAPAPSGQSEDAVSLALARARERLAAGALALPPEDSAAGSVLAALRIAPDHAEALALLAEIGDTILARTSEAKRLGDAAALRAALTEAEEFATMQGEQGEDFRARLRARLEASPPSSAEIASVLRDFGIGADATTLPGAPTAPATAAEQPPSLPRHFVDVPAELRNARAHSRLGGRLAALPRPVSRREFEEFLSATGHRPAPCRGEGALGAIRQRSFHDPGFPQEADDPAVCVSYADAEAFAAWLSRRLGRRARLPSGDELQHLALHQIAALNRPLTVREWSADCAGRGGSCLRRTVLDPGLDGRRWPLEALALEARRGRSDVGFRLVLE